MFYLSSEREFQLHDYNLSLDASIRISRTSSALTDSAHPSPVDRSSRRFISTNGLGWRGVSEICCKPHMYLGYLY
jgi:hypothetical protein